MAKRDKAVETARSFVDGQICECGCTEGDHATWTPERKCCECRCQAFRPVRFEVTRAKEA